MSILWGIDLGGTKVEGVVLEEGYPPRTLARLRVPTEKEKGYRHIVGQIGLLVEALKKETGLRPEKVGIGTPGTGERSAQVGERRRAVRQAGKPVVRRLVGEPPAELLAFDE